VAVLHPVPVAVLYLVHVALLSRISCGGIASGS
jgi:hypothetical protein